MGRVNMRLIRLHLVYIYISKQFVITGVAQKIETFSCWQSSICSLCHFMGLFWQRLWLELWIEGARSAYGLMFCECPILWLGSSCTYSRWDCFMNWTNALKMRVAWRLKPNYCSNVVRVNRYTIRCQCVISVPSLLSLSAKIYRVELPRFKYLAPFHALMYPAWLWGTVPEY